MSPLVGSYCVGRGSNVKLLPLVACAGCVRAPRSGFRFLALGAMAGLTALLIPAAQAQDAGSTDSDVRPIEVAQATVIAAAAGSEAALAVPSAAKPKKTRFIIGLDRKVTYSVSTLSEPNRVIVELPDARIELPQLNGDRPQGLVKALRNGLSAPGRQRIVIDVTSPVVIEKSRIDKSPEGTGYHLTLEIAPLQAALARNQKGLDATQMKLGVQPPLPRPAEKPSARAARAFKPVIVIDPGHGGHDTGATKFGTVEKNVVLAFSKMLRDKLEATGRYRVLMTRDTDVFIPLDDRRAFGERHNANLFIAVHADYASTRARGATIYSLRDGVADRLKRSAQADAEDDVLSKAELAKVEKAASASGDVDTVKDMLADLKRREIDTTKERTSIFARTVIEYMGGSTNLRDDPDQQAAFRVLKTAQFPSVLIELAYVSNREDAEQLNSDAWRNKVSGSIKTAIDNYFGQSLARLPL